MIALAPQESRPQPPSDAAVVDPAAPPLSASPAPEPTSSQPWKSRSDKTAWRSQRAAPFDARDEAPTQGPAQGPAQGLAVASASGAARVMHDGGAALTGLSQTPEAFYAGPSNGPGERAGVQEGCGGAEGRCSPGGSALAADRRVRQAFAEAAAAGVSEEVLTGLKRNWSEIHDRYSERPGDLVTQYIRLADALLRARDRARMREQAGDEAGGQPRWTPDR